MRIRYFRFWSVQIFDIFITTFLGVEHDIFVRRRNLSFSILFPFNWFCFDAKFFLFLDGFTICFVIREVL